MVRLPSKLRHLSLSAAYENAEPAGLVGLLQSATQLEALSLHGFGRPPRGVSLPASLQSMFLGNPSIDLWGPTTDQVLEGAALRVAAQRVELWSAPCRGEAGEEAVRCNDEKPSACGAFAQLHLTFAHVDIKDVCYKCGRVYRDALASTAVARLMEVLTHDNLPACIELWSAAGDGSFVFRWAEHLSGDLHLERYAASSDLLEELKTSSAASHFSCSELQKDGRKGIILRRRDQ